MKLKVYHVNVKQCSLRGNSEMLRAVLFVVNVTVVPRGKSENTTSSSENSLHHDT
jgi:hypothetical protein